MLAVEEALSIVLNHCRPRAAEETSLSPRALGCILGEEIASDLDLPPFDKALMDGFAVRAADVGEDRCELPVAAEVMAGQIPPALVAGQAIRIMTGAPIPDGADAVIRVEQTAMIAADRVQFQGPRPKPGQFILRRGAEMKRGDIVLRSGTEITPQILGLLASVGRTAVRLIAPPSVCVMATGDELVEASQTPGPGQLRNSNGPMLVAQVTTTGASVRSLGIAPDERETMTAMIRDALTSDIVILSGGVSMGKRDLVPEVLQELGVAAHVHQVAMKPGKPFFFGTRGETLVFGLPGNPVSSFCCFELFVRPAIRRLAGYAEPGPLWQEAALAEDFSHASDRPTYHPARLQQRGGANEVKPVAWFGSPDLRAVAGANALMLLPPGSQTFQAGTHLLVLPLRS